MRYELQAENLLFRFEDDADLKGKMIGFIFHPEDAVILTAMLNASLALANAVLSDDDGPARRHQVTIGEPGGPVHTYSWDGETQ